MLLTSSVSRKSMTSARQPSSSRVRHSRSIALAAHLVDVVARVDDGDLAAARSYERGRASARFLHCRFVPFYLRRYFVIRSRVPSSTRSNSTSSISVRMSLSPQPRRPCRACPSASRAVAAVGL